MSSRWTAAALALLAGVLTIPAPAAAQYFGRNKVQYQSFDFRAMHTKHFDLFYYPAESLAASDAARMAERWYVRHSATLQDEFTKRSIVLYADAPDFQQTNVVGGFISQGTGGVTEGLRSRVVLPFTGVYAENDHVLGHELVHVFQYDIAGSMRGGGMANLNRLPLWLIEGMAEYLSLGRNDVNTAMWLRDAALHKDIPSIKQLSTDPRYFPYRYGEALWAYIGGTWGDQIIAPLYRAALSRGWDPAVESVLGLSSDSLSAQWHRAIVAEYEPMMKGRTHPDSTGDRILPGGNQLGNMDVSPAISPDGRFMAFYTSRGLFNIDLYIADVETGKIVKKLTSPNRDQHFDAINFISSAGSWSPDGKKFAFVVYADGDNEIAIYDVDRQKQVQQIHLRGVTAINDVDWGPNDQLAISGMAGGISDLYLYDLRTGAQRQLTHDRYADLQPAWSPDGNSIAFVTDSGPRTDFTELRYGKMRIGIMDVASGTVRMLDLFADAKNINPQYSPDGTELYFVSDQGGFDDLYRVNLSSGAIQQLTHIATGVSGITDLSPTLSVARRTGRIVFSVFDHGGNTLRRLEPSALPPASAPAVALTPGDTLNLAGVLPPTGVANGGEVTMRVNDYRTGLEPPQAYGTSSYKSSLSLEYIGGTAGVGFTNGPLGTVAGGGIAAYFSDLLGNNVIGVQTGGGGDVRNISGQVVYQNLAHRWNWGVGLSHVPFITGFAACCQDTTLAGFPAAIYEQQIFRTYFESANVMAQYPFSLTRRLELSAGFSHIGFGTEIDRFFLIGNSVVGEDRINGPAPPGLNLFQSSAALVGDYSFFGFTSPVAGGRYRFEVDPTAGDLNFLTGLADYRRYFFTRPVTFAFRGIHLGRYGKDAENNALYPLFLGDQSLIRGYEAGSFTPADCPSLGAVDSTSATGCPLIDHLLGSRLAVANFEFRIPVLGTQQLGLINFPYLLMELAPFVDAGYAWNSSNNQGRKVIWSSGITSRFNLFGYLVAEIYWAHPFDRPGTTSRWGFQIAPGW